MPDAARTSLQRLQALEKDFTDFETQLRGLCEIIQALSLLTQDATKVARKKVADGRLDFALRWVLGKLKQTGESGMRARSSPAAWTLLANLINTLHLAPAVRALNAAGILSILQSALHENFQHPQHSSKLSPVKEAQVAEDSSPANTEPPSQKKSKKRKRETGQNEQEQDALVSKRRATGSTTNDMRMASEAQLQLYGALRMCLKVLVGLLHADSMNLEGSGPATSSLRAVLTSDGAEAAQMLSGWLFAFVLVARTSSSYPTNSDLDCALTLWRQRRNKTSHDSRDELLAFSGLCILPASALLYHLRNTRLSMSKSDADFSRLSNDISQLERLLAECALIPAKRLWRQQRSDPEAREHRSTILKEVLASLYDESSIRYYVPPLFEIAIRCTPMSTPRKRIAESPWLEAVFKTLAACLGCGLGSSDDEEVWKDGDVEQLRQLLHSVSKHSIKLSRETTGMILIRYTGRVPYGHNVIADLVRIDPNIYVDDQGALTTTLSMLGRFNEKDEGYYIVRNEILIPLLRAHVVARSLKSFIALWRNQLSSHFSSYPDPSTTPTSRICLWEDPVLAQALGHHIDVAFTSRQLVDLVASISAPLEINMHQQNQNIASVISSASMLSMIVMAIRSVDNATILANEARDLLNLALSILTAAEDHQVLLRSRLWTLVASLLRLLLSVISPSELIDSALTWCKRINDLADDLLAQAIEDGNLNDERLSCISCLVSICVNIEARHSSSRPFHSSLKQIRKLVKSLDVTTPSSTLVRLSEVLATRPSMLASQEEMDASWNAQASKSLIDWIHRASRSSSSRDSDREDAKQQWKLLIKSLTGTKTVTKDPSAQQDQDVNDTRVKRPTMLNLDKDQVEQTVIATSSTLMNADNQKLSTAEWSAALSYLIKNLGDCRADSVSLLKFPNALTTIAQKLDHHLNNLTTRDVDDLGLPVLYFRLSQLVMKYHLEHKEEDVSRHYIQNGGTQLLSVLHAMTGDLNGHLAILAWWKAVLSAASGQALFAVDVDDLCGRICQMLNVIASSKLEEREKSVHGIAAGIDVLCLMESVILARQRETLFSVAKNKALTVLQDDSVRARLFRLDCNLKLVDATMPYVQDVMSLLDELHDRESIMIVESAMVDSVAGAYSDARLVFLQDLLPSSDVSGYDTRKLRILHVLIKASTTKPYKMLLSEDYIALCASSLQNYIPYASSLASLTYAAHSLRNLLESHGRHLPQFVIEASLSTIVSVGSPSASAKIPASPQAARRIFTLMNSTLQALLTHHRRKLRGRFDILVLALQALLRCLFTSSSTSSFGRLQHPSWLPSKAASGEDRGLDAVHVAAYTRLLTSICDPTLSAVRSSFRRNSATGPLTDETQKAKRYAGQYMQFVLMELCECQLKGRLVGGAEGAREALTPGVYAMLEVIGKEGLSACMEGMAGGGRSVLRTWWEEWRRLGRKRW